MTWRRQADTHTEGAIIVADECATTSNTSTARFSVQVRVTHLAHQRAVRWVKLQQQHRQQLVDYALKAVILNQREAIRHVVDKVLLNGK